MTVYQFLTLASFLLLYHRIWTVWMGLIDLHKKIDDLKKMSDRKERPEVGLNDRLNDLQKMKFSPGINPRSLE